MLSQILSTLSSSTALVVLVLLILSISFLRRRKNLPPGPRGLPLIGSIPFLGKNLAAEALRLSKEYNSDVITIRLGPITAIFLNTYDAIKDALSSNDFTDRPDDIFFKKCICYGAGVAASDGAVWKEHRRFSLSLLRDFGMGKMAAEEKIITETRCLMEEIQNRGPEKFDISHLLTTAVANIICTIVFSRRYAFDDKDFWRYCARFRENAKKAGQGNPLTVMPSLRHIPGDLFHYKQVMINVNAVNDFLKKIIQEHREKLDPARVDDFLDAYLLEKRRQDEQNPENTFTDWQVLNVIADLFIAGTETSSTTVHWGLLYMINFPEIQEKIHQEIDSVIGRDREPTMMDKRHLPYTEAAILEVHRVGSVGALGVPHANNREDVQFRGYTIPKGSFIMPNVWAVHRDPTLWKYPEGFHPENFLNEKGEVDVPKAWIPFVIGRRQCPGESLAKMEVFLVMTSLLQKFHFSVPEGASKPDLEGVLGLSFSPKPFELCVSVRS